MRTYETRGIEFEIRWLVNKKLTLIGGGNWKFGWGPQDDAASIAAIRQARCVDCGSKVRGALIQEAGQLLAAAGLLQLANRLGLNLPHALPRNFEYTPHFLQSVGVAVAQPVPQADPHT